MSELTLTHTENRAKRRFDVWRVDGSVHLRLRERMHNFTTDEMETVVDNTVSYDLADDGETVAHDGSKWQEYAEQRFQTLNSKRFQ